MAIVEKIGGLKLPFIPKQKPAEDERLLQLFRNRAGLKKAHATLQDDFYELKDRLKQQETATGRVQEQLEGLESLLGNPEAGFGALVFFQLRGLWRSCHSQLSLFAAELERQQEERERRKQMFEFNQELNARLAQIDARLVVADAEVEQQQQQLSALEARYQKLKGFWNYFKRRRLMGEIVRQRAQVESVRRQSNLIGEERTLVSQAECASFPGLAVEGRRMINLVSIAYALVLGARLSMHGLATKAKDAVLRRVNEAQYGSRADCEALMTAIAQSLAIVKSRKDIAAEIKGCVAMLKEVANYRSQSDTVPLAETLAGVVPAAPGGRAVLALSGPQILADDYWDIYKVLLR